MSQDPEGAKPADCRSGSEKFLLVIT